MRLRLTFGLCALALALALAACGGGEEEETPSGGQQQATPTAEKTGQATETPAAGEKPSGGGEVSLKNVPVYPGANKVAEGSGASPVAPLPGGEGPNVGDYPNASWAIYETGDSVDKVAQFYKDKMPDNGWDEEGWFETSGEGAAAWGAYTRDNGNAAAWFVASSNDKTDIVIGIGSR